MAHSIIDKGWSNMESLLDKELPLKKKKKRLLYWVFLGLGLIIALALNQVINLNETQNNHNTVNSTIVQSDQIPSQNKIDDIDPVVNGSLDETSKITSSVQISKSKFAVKETNYYTTPNASSNGILPVKSKTEQLSLNNQKSNNNEDPVAHFQSGSNSSNSTIAPIVTRKITTKEDQLSAINENTDSDPQIQTGFIAPNDETNQNKKSVGSENIQLLVSSNQLLNRVPSIDIKSIESETYTIYPFGNPVIKVSKPSLKEEKSALYFSLKAFTFEVPKNFEVGYNHQLYKKSKFSVYGSVGVLLNTPSIDFVSDQFDLDPVILGGTSIGSEAFADVLKNEYFENIGFSTKRNYAAKLGLGLELKLSKRLAISNEGALYHYLKSNVVNSPKSSNQPLVELKQNRLILSNLTSVAFRVSKRFNIFAGYQFSVVPEYEIILDETQKYSKSKEILLGTQYLF